MATDFYDQDLSGLTTDQTLSSQTTAQHSESFYDRRKRELPEEITQNGDEMERLRQRQEALERRKQELVEQRRKIELFEHNRRDLLDKLRRNAVMVVRQGEQASRVAAICNEASSLFSSLHQSLEAFAPETWDESEYDARLTEALAKVDASTQEYRKTMDRISATDWHTSVADTDENVNFSTSTNHQQTSFLRWIVAGAAFGIPVVILFSLAVILFLRFYANK